MIFARKVDMLNEKQNGKQQKVKDSKVIAEGSGDKSWWEKKDLESKRWFLYTALAVIAITAVYVTPDKYSEYRFIVGGWIVLLGLHLVIWPFFTEKISVVTKIVITGFILFFIVAVILPNATQKEVANVKEKVASFDENYGKTPSPSLATLQAQPVVTTVVSQPKLISVELAIPADATIAAVPPEGHRLSSVRCPSENVMELTDWATHKVRQIDCAGRLTLEEDDLRNKEIVFFQKPGGSGPSVVIVRWVKV